MNDDDTHGSFQDPLIFLAGFVAVVFLIMSIQRFPYGIDNIIEACKIWPK